MENLVFVRHISDRCTYSYELPVSFWYESKKKAEDKIFEYAYECLNVYLKSYNSDNWYDLTLWLKENVLFRDHEFEFYDFWEYAHPKFDKKGRHIPEELKEDNYIYKNPTILTLEEWFQQNQSELLWTSKN